MAAKLSTDQINDLLAHGVIDPTTNREYVVVQKEIHIQAMDALRAREDEDAIRQGIADMEAGRHYSMDEVRAELERRQSDRAAQ